MRCRPKISINKNVEDAKQIGQENYEMNTNYTFIKVWPDEQFVTAY
jgi:hypothetical protein